MKIMALYLPAFHRIPENDEWWGEGFTEWDNVRAGKRYFQSHVQPVIPLHNNYYDLSKKENIEKQISLANEYGVDGFIMYHYWFGAGKKLFEGPAEILRKQISSKIEYSFCWANDTWITTWHGKEPKELIAQKYPGEKDWEAHINYLIKFFTDERYSKVNDHPVLYIYKPNEIPNYEAMIDYWNRKLAEKGLKNLYVVEYISSKNRGLYSLKSNAVVEFEPLYTTFFDLGIVSLAKRWFAKKTHNIDYQKYDELWQKIIKRTRTYSGKPIIRGCFVAWDNSPRKEKNSMIVRGASPEAFERYFTQLLTSKRQDASEEFVVINAWNEWSEGAYLEPDEEHGYAYLNAIKNARRNANC